MVATNPLDAKIEVAPRSVFTGRGRSRKVYDARLALRRERIEATGNSPAEARSKVRAIASFVEHALASEMDGWRLVPSTYACGEWALRFPSGGVHVFPAKTFGDAVNRLLGEYAADHPVRGFLRDCQARPAVEIL